MLPSGSDEPVPSTLTDSPFVVDVNAATGGWLAAVTVTCLVSVSVAPWLSVTVSVTV